MKKMYFLLFKSYKNFVVEKQFLMKTWTSFLMRVVQTQPSTLILHSTEESVWRAEVQMRLHFHFNFTVQFKSPYSLSSNFIFSISNITISFRKLILGVKEPYVSYFSLRFWKSDGSSKECLKQRDNTVRQTNKNETSVSISRMLNIFWHAIYCLIHRLKWTWWTQM